MVLNEKYKMNNSLEIPKVALGTWLIDDGKAAQAVRDAVNIGYRHIDTAQAYLNERGVGEGIRTCGVPREEIFITSKVAAENKSYDSAALSIDETLKKTGLDYVDMMIIHCPQPWAEVGKTENRYYKENQAVWKALEDAVNDGKIKTIGVSNFMEEDIENILDVCDIKPAVNQILAHISNTPFDMINYCKSKDILVEAYSPIAHGEILQNKNMVKIADKYGVSVPQICIKYDLQLGMVVLPKTDNPDHMRMNAELDFVISDDDMNFLKNMERIRNYGKSSVFPIFKVTDD